MRRPKKVLLLVSGSGQPRDTNADPDANSTHCTSYLVERFVQLCYAGAAGGGPFFSQRLLF